MSVSNFNSIFSILGHLTPVSLIVKPDYTIENLDVVEDIEPDPVTIYAWIAPLTPQQYKHYPKGTKITDFLRMRVDDSKYSIELGNIIEHAGIRYLVIEKQSQAETFTNVGHYILQKSDD